MKAPAHDPSTTAARPGGSLPYRNDLDGLRALAIVVVVAFHAEVEGFGGGFVGVDVFLVLSGWLITRQLVQMSDQGSGRVLLLDFWARRVRRLVPALAVMILVVSGLCLLVLGPLDWDLIGPRGAAAALYVPNIGYALSAGDYFSGPLQESPYLHTWSLGVEEQFYVLWPVLFLVATVLGRGAAGSRRTLRIALGSVLVASLAGSVVLTGRGSVWAFYGLQSRAWEFAAGGLLAICLPSGRSVPRVARTWAPPVGVGLIALAVVTFDDTTPFPGLAALVPVVGTLLVTVGGQGAGEPPLVTRALSTRPAVAVGRLSYSWYLYHWPFIVLAASYSDTTSARLLAVAASIPVALLSLLLVENPIRHSLALRRSLWKTFGIGLIATVAGLGASLALMEAGGQRLQREPYRSWEEARQSFRDPGCREETTPAGDPYCLGGDPEGDRLVAVVGDSHALQWMVAFGRAGEELGVRVVLRASGNCSATPLPGDLGDRSCRDFQHRTDAVLESLRPDVVVLSDARSSRSTFGSPDAWADATIAFIEAQASAGRGTAVVRDNPALGDPLLCLTRGRGERACTPSAAEASRAQEPYERAEARVARGAGGRLRQLDVSTVLCDEVDCPLSRDGRWVFAASSHLTRDFTVSQTDAIVDVLSGALGRGR